MGREQAPVEAFDESKETRGSLFTGRRAVAGAAVAAVALSVGGYKGGELYGEFAAANRPHAELSSGEVVAERALIEPIDFECSAWSKWDVEAKYDYQYEIAGKEIDGFGGSVTFEKPTAIMLQYCLKSPKSNEPELIERDGQTLVKVPVDKMYLNAQFPSGNKHFDLNPYNGLKTGGSAAGLASGLAGLGCDGLSFGKDKIGELFGKDAKADDKDECNGFASKIDGFYRDFYSNTGNRASDQLLADVREHAAKADWKDVQNIYRDKTKAAAIERGGGDRSDADKVDAVFVDENGKPTDELPEFKDIFEDLRKRGVLENPDVNVEETKFTAKKAGTSYVPKYFDPREDKINE